MFNIRNYNPNDYDQVAEIYKRSELYGGQFDENRDSRDRLDDKTKNDPEAILVCESEGKITGTVSLIEDGRVAWLFRFAVLEGEHKENIARALFEKASKILKARGHRQVLVYSPVGNTNFDARYTDTLGFEKGSDYTCFWKYI